MGYYYNGRAETLEGFWGAIGSGLKTVGKFAVKAVTGVDVNGEPVTETTDGTDVISDRSGESFLDRLRRRAQERLAADQQVRDTAVQWTSQLPPELLASAAYQQGLRQSAEDKAKFILPALAVAALVLRKR